MNLYKGCPHGCIYCDSRSECYQIQDFDKVRIKENALFILRGELKRKVNKGVIFTGSMSDPYNPLEKELELTKNALELIDTYGFGISIATKSSLVTRDIERLIAIKSHSPTLVKVTLTTAEDSLAKKIEPCVSSPSERFATIKELSERGIFTGVLMMPILPFIEDSEENVYEIIKKAHENGAKFIYPAIGMTMRDSQREYFYEKLDKHFPGMKNKYIRTYGNKYWCIAPKGKELYGLLQRECRQRGLLYKMPDIIEAYKKGYGVKQISLFE